MALGILENINVKMSVSGEFKWKCEIVKMFAYISEITTDIDLK